MRFRNIDPRLFTILLIVFAQMLAASMALPILPLYAKHDFNMQPEVITLLLASFFAAQFLGGPYLGRLSDRYGRIPVLIVSQAGTVISFIMLVVAQSPWILLASRILDGITGGNIIVAQAYVTDVTPKHERTQSLGLIFAAFGLGFTFGPVLGGIFGAAFGDRMPFIIAAIGTTIPLIMTWRNLDETVTPELRERNRNYSKASLQPRQMLNNFPLVLTLLMGFWSQFGLGMVQGTFSLYGEVVLFKNYSPKTASLGIGLTLTMLGVGQLITQLFLLKPLLKRYGDAMLVVIGTLIRGAAMFVFAMITYPWLGLPTASFMAIGAGMMMPPLQSLCTYTVADELRGGVLGIYQSAQSLATIFSTALGGVLFAINPHLPYYTIGVIFWLLAPAGIFFMRWSRAHNVPGAFPIPAPTAGD